MKQSCRQLYLNLFVKQPVNVGMIMAMKENEARMEAEDKARKELGYCPKCHMVKTTSGKCAWGCV